MIQVAKRALCAALVVAATHIVAGAGHAQTFPDRPIKLSVGFPAGTGPDLLARVVGQRLSELVKQPVFVDNRPGAGGQIATQLVAKSAADGYSLLLAEAGSVSIAPAAFGKLAYDPVRELVGVAELAWADFVLVVPASSKYKGLADMVLANKGRSNPLNFATFGAGSPGHFGAVEFGMQTGVKVEPIHFRSTGDAVTAIFSGDVDGAWVSTAVASAQLKGGKMRALATTAKTRSPLVPEVPTTAEVGLPKLDFSSWLGVLAPAGTPDVALEVLSRNLLLAMQSPEVKQKLLEAGFSVTGTGREETARMLRNEATRWGAIVQASGFKGD
jgi:tripartite-type tricarboxylate transporter receptor subunit TctC